MAKNGPRGGGRRGAVTKRFQTYNPSTKRWTKHNADTGKFIDQKSDAAPFKGVTKKD